MLLLVLTLMGSTIANNGADGTTGVAKRGLLTQYGLLPLKLPQKVQIISDRIIVPVEWNEKLLLDLYENITPTIRSLEIAENIPNYVRADLERMLREITRSYDILMYYTKWYLQTL